MLQRKGRFYKGFRTLKFFRWNQFSNLKHVEIYFVATILVLEVKSFGDVRSAGS
jgi:hypothetical protein